MMNNDENYSINKLIGFGSKHESERLKFQLCCECFDKVIENITPMFPVPPLEGNNDLLFEKHKTVDGLTYTDESFCYKPIKGLILSLPVCACVLTTYTKQTMRMVSTIRGNKILSIGKNAFKNNIDNVAVIGKYVQEIREEAFKNCKNLERIYIPISVKTIEKNAFMGCDNLKEVYYQGTQEQWKQIRIVTNKRTVTSTGNGSQFIEKFETFTGNNNLLNAKFFYEYNATDEANNGK